MINFNKNRIVLLAALVGAGLLTIYFILFASPVRASNVEVFSISRNADMEKIVSQLKSKGFIRSALGFGFVRGLAGAGKIEPGGYRISKAMNVWQIARILGSKPELKWITLPEGLRKEEIADIFGDALKWNDEEKSKFINYNSGKAEYVEGIYFPDTYLIPINGTAGETAERMIAEFEKQFAPYRQKALKENIRWYTALKIASIVQREAAGNSDMPIIAGVVWNRLLKGMKLDIDATLQYARGRVKTDSDESWWAPIKVEDKKVDSPYNTYLRKGLPPHPISNPGLAAIDAVFNPTKTDCLYYLHDSSRKIYCAKTFDEHQENINKYLRN